MTSDVPERPVEQVDAKVAAKLFKKDSAPYVHGPFGPPTPPTVQQAIDKGNLYATKLNEDPQVLVIANLMKSSSTHTDFAQNDWQIKAGELFATDIAKAPDALDADIGDLLDYIQSRHETPMWVEIYEEDGAKRRVLQTQEFSYRCTKVNAYGDLTGLYYRPWPPVRTAPPVEQAHDVATLTRLAPLFIDERERDAILSELHEFAAWWSAYSGQQVWADHYSTYNKKYTWSAFSLRNFEPEDPTSIVKPQEMPRDWKQEHADKLNNECADSIAFDHFPTVRAIMQRLEHEGYGAGFERVRLMRLTAKGGELTRHSDITDRKAGTKDGYVTRLHIPLVTDERVEFSMWGHRGQKYQRYMSPFDLWLLDMRKPHAAVNKSDDCERIHLVIDVVSNDSLRQQIADAHAYEEATGELADAHVDDPLWTRAS